MSSSSVWLVLAITAVVIVLGRSSQLSDQQIREYLKAGAIVIDVRTAAEFNAGHLSSAINIPLEQLETLVPNAVKDKNQVILLHCASGMRRGMGVGKLKARGYTKVFNLGSFGRAAGILGPVV